jgi:predicted O-methyltransferase YrrM
MMNEEVAHEQCLTLMKALVQYRHQPVYRQLRRFGRRQSMLHSDVLQLLYHLARTGRGAIVEVGPFRGGSTVALALGMRDGGNARKFITIEQGGRLRGHRLRTGNIVRTLKRNLARKRVADLVTVLEGRSSDERIVAAVHDALDQEGIGLLVLDADAGVKRDLDLFAARLNDHCWIVIDDYYAGAGGGDKGGPTTEQVDALVAAAQLLPLGYYGLGTWFGHWLKPPPAR